MSREIQEVKDGLLLLETRQQEALALANATTGKTDTDLTSAVGSLVEGFGQGGSGGEDTLTALFNKTLTYYKHDTLVRIQAANFFEYSSQLIEVDFPSMKNMNDGTFKSCYKLEKVNFPLAEYVGANAFQNCLVIENFNFPKASTVYTLSFGGCTKLKKVDIGVTTNFARPQAFSGCTSFDTLILRGNGVSTLSNVNNFEKTPFASGGSGGTIYVPSALIEAYKTATNWSVLYEGGSCNFVAIEGSEYE